MKRMLLAALMSCGLVVWTGCQGTQSLGNDLSTEQRVFGDFEIAGHNQHVRILPGSRVRHLKIVGNNNRVEVMDDVTLYKIEAWGNDNEVTLPDLLREVTFNRVGRNTLVFRPSMPRMDSQWLPPAEPTPTLPPPATSPTAQPARPAPPPPEADLPADEFDYE